jgi:hypothetical protein
MPYTIRKQSGPRPYKIVKPNTGKVVGSSVTKKDAEASIRARWAGEAKKRK